MRRALLPAVLALAFCLQAKGQVFIINDNMTAGRLSEIHVTVLDSLTSEPVPFASVYVIPAKDTTISNFTLTDQEGKAKLEEVPYGNYTFHIEMLGFKPFVKERYFRDRMVDMGTVKLQVDENYLKAAMVTDVGNPIVVKKDTVEFNASSFQVGTNAMLKDLLLRMPGMEITEEGKVKFNGEEIDKLTVGGRTFFFDDQSTALNNLPASIVDKVRVIDRESENTRDTGLQDGSREKVLDVGLKKEYEKGWFGNAGVKGGTTFVGDKDDPLRDDRGLLYSGNALVSAYSEKDQLTLIANGMNTQDSNGNVVFVMVNSDGTRTSNMGQIASAAQFGANLNTSRIKNFETTLGANYKYGDSMSGGKTFRTTFQDDGNIFSASESSGRQFSNIVSANAEMKKEKGKTVVRVEPRFRYSKINSFSSSSSETSREESFINSSSNQSRELNTEKSFGGYGSVTFRELWGKKDRIINLGFSGSHEDSEGESNENSLMTLASGEDRRDMRYLSDMKSRSASGTIRYAEPIGDKFTLSASADMSFRRQNSIRDAFDASGRNDLYSSESRTRTIDDAFDLTGQYKFSKNTWMTLGAIFNGMLNETWSKSWGISTTTGEGEWYWHLAPHLRFQHTSGNDRYNVSASGYNQQPSRAAMLPTMNITNLSRPSIGNIYLKPFGYTYASLSWNRNNKGNFSTLMLSAYGYFNSNPITYARWYDADGVLYSVPVNSRKISKSVHLYSNYTTPLDGKKKLFLTVGASGSYDISTSYQSKGILPGIDKDAFDYTTFMESFWGGPEGDRFYGGKSGFAESMTSSLSPSANITLRYSSGSFSSRVFSNFGWEISRYSLNPSMNMNTMDSKLGMAANYTTKHEFEFDTDLAYAWYRGYAAGYGAPEWQWNAEISKNIKAFNFSIMIHDILDQTRNLTHTVTANYEEDAYQLVMGRYILFGVKWNFGKMNAAHNQRAQNAAWNMVF